MIIFHRTSYFGDVYTFARTEGMVYHMEVDLYEHGNILFSDGHSLKTTDGNVTMNVAGSATEAGYAEGEADTARFHAITGFHQITKTEVIVINWGKNCLMKVYRSSKLAMTYAGKCTEYGFSDGRLREARFGSLISIIADRRNPSQLIVSDVSNNALWVIDTVTERVRTLFQSDKLEKPRGIAVDPNNINTLYITASQSQVFRLDLTTKALTLVSGKPVVERLVDGAFRDAIFAYPREIINLSDGVFAIAGQQSMRIRLLDFKTERVSSLCSGIKGKVDGSVNTCQVDTPYSLLLFNKTFYIGESQSIRAIPGIYQSILISYQVF